jgi:hypothetical protein
MSLLGKVYRDDTGIHWTVKKEGGYIVVLRDNRGLKGDRTLGWYDFQARIMAGEFIEAIQTPPGASRVDYLYCCTWKDGIQGPDGRMLTLSVKIVRGLSCEGLMDYLKQGWTVTSNVENITEIIKHYGMVKDQNLSAAYDLNYFRHESQVIL